MRRNVAVCAILLAMGLGARTYFLTVKDGRRCRVLHSLTRAGAYPCCRARRTGRFCRRVCMSRDGRL